MEMSGTCFEIVSRWLPKHSLQQSGRRLFQAAWFRNRRVWWAREEWKGWACMRNVGAGVGGVCVGVAQRSIPASFCQRSGQ